MKRIFIFGCVLIVVGVGVAALMFRTVSTEGSSGVERWIGMQFQTIANSYLNPQLSFTDLDYEYPLTVSLKNLQLKAEDPARPGETIDIIACDSATITLAEIPSVGKPIAIERMIFDRPLLSAVSHSAEDKALIGFSDLVKGGISKSPTTAPATRPALSDVFRIRLIRINDGRILYNPRIAGTEAMELDKINTTLNVQPSEGGWYQFDTAIARSPVFDLALAGQLNVDTFVARALKLNLAAGVTQEDLSYLPPQLQQILKQYQVSGQLNVRATGQVPLMDPATGEGQADIRLRQANITLGDYRIPVENFDISAQLAERKLSVPTLKMEAMKGTAQGQANVQLSGEYDTQANLTITGMQVQEALATRQTGEPLKLAGRLDAAMQVSAPIKTVLAHATTQPATMPVASLPAKWGSGTVNLADGRLLQIKLFSQLADTVGKAVNIVSAGRLSETPRERVRILFAMESNHINVTDFTYVGEYVAARGEGTIGLNRALDLKVSAGPVERVQAMLGEHIGGAIAAVTDSLLAYRVTGIIGSPEVQPVIGGGAIGNVGEGIGNIGRGIGNILRPQDRERQQGRGPE